MSEPQRIGPTLIALGRLWRKSPNMRLGQLIVNLCKRDDPFLIDDDELLHRIHMAHDWYPMQPFTGDCDHTKGE